MKMFSQKASLTSSLSLHCILLLHFTLIMEDILATMWNSLPLSKNEALTLNIDTNKLSAPKNALIGKLAMKKHVSSFELDKGLKSFWDANNAMETTPIGDNLFLFAFEEADTCECIFKNQPWNFRGSLVLFDHLLGDKCPATFSINMVPFWI